MCSELQKLNNYPSFSMTNGMILQEAMREKNISFTELFQILGPKSVIMEVIHGKRILKSIQIRQLSELFNMAQEVFHSEELNGDRQNESLENRNHDMNCNSLPSQEEGYNNENQLNSFGEEERINRNDFDEIPDPENGIKPFWEE